MFTRRMAFAITIGCIFGSSIASLMNFTLLSCVVGALVGGVIAWLALTVRDIIYHAPRVFAKVFDYRPNTIVWKSFAKEVFLFFAADIIAGLAILATILSVVTVFSLNPVATLVWMAKLSEGPITLLAICLVLPMCAAMMMIKQPRASRVGMPGKFMRRRMRALLVVTTFIMFWLAKWINPVGIPVGLTRLFIKNGRDLWQAYVQIGSLLGRGIVTLFVLVHSKQASACFVYTAIAVAIAAFGVHDWRAIPVSVAVGLGFAFVGSLIAPRVPNHMILH